MKRIMRMAFSGIVAVFLMGCSAADINDAIANILFSNDVETAVPDNGHVASDLNVVSNIISLTKISVIVTIDHTNVGDLSLYLVSPEGTTITLSRNNGGSGDDYAATYFSSDDPSDESITNGVAPFSGVYQPEGSLLNLNDENPNGSWTLHVYDNNLNGETGKIIIWALLISGDRA